MQNKEVVREKQKEKEEKEKEKEKEKENRFFITREMVQEYLNDSEEKREASNGNLLRFLLDGVIASYKGDQAASERAKAEIMKSDVVLGPDLAELIGQFHSNTGRTGLRLRKALNNKGSYTLDPDLYYAVAEIRKILPSGQFFASVIGMMVGESLLELSPGEARKVYPLAGEILAFPNTISGHHHEGELAIWRTERHETDKQNKLIITSLHARLYEVIPVPHPSSDPDSLREWLLSFYQNPTANLPIFQLSDGGLVRLPGDPKDTKLYKFENPIDLYESLDAIELANGRRLVVSPLPAASQKLDCAPPITTIKRLLKMQKSGEQFPHFSRAQVDSLSDFIKAEVDYSLSPSLARATERLGSVAELKEKLNEVVTELMLLPEVSQQIEEEKKSLLLKFADDQNDFKNNLQKLKDEKIKLEGEISAARKSIKMQEQELVSRIREKFQKAQSEGVETLAQVALFRSLIGVSQTSDPRLSKEAIKTGSLFTSLETGAELASLDALKLALARSSYSSGQSTQLMSAVISSAFVCGAVGLIGEKKEAVVQMLGTVLAGGVTCSVSISVDMFSISNVFSAPALVKVGGLSIGMTFGEFLEMQSSLGRTSVVELVGANRMPPESYLPDLMNIFRPSSTPSSVVWTGPDGNIKTTTFNYPVILLLSFLSGKSTFPMMSPLSTQIPLVAVDIQWGDEPLKDDSVIVKTSHLSVLVRSELTQNLSMRTVGNISLISGDSEVLSMALENFGCIDSESLAKVILHAGRPGYVHDFSYVNSNSTGIVQKIHETIQLCSTSLFAQSIDEERRG